VLIDDEIKEIKDGREKLNKLIEKYGLSNEQVLEASRELDSLLWKYKDYYLGANKKDG
jgi:hypothetical protein